MAIDVAKRFVADEVGHSATIVTKAVRDDVGALMERQDGLSSRAAEVAAVIAKAGSYCGSITIDGAVIVSPCDEDDLILIALSEGEKRRVLAEPLYIMDAKEGGLQIGEESEQLHPVHLGKAIQALFC